MLMWQRFILYLMLNHSQQRLHWPYIFCNSRQVLETLESPLNHEDAPSLLRNDLSRISPKWMGRGSSNLPAPHGSEKDSCFPKSDSIWISLVVVGRWGGAGGPETTDKTTESNPISRGFHQKLCCEIRQIFVYQGSEWRKEPIRNILLGRLLVFFHCYLSTDSMEIVSFGAMRQTPWHDEGHACIWNSIPLNTCLKKAS